MVALPTGMKPPNCAWARKFSYCDFQRKQSTIKSSQKTQAVQVVHARIAEVRVCATHQLEGCKHLSHLLWDVFKWHLELRQEADHTKHDQQLCQAVRHSHRK